MRKNRFYPRMVHEHVARVAYGLRPTPKTSPMSRAMLQVRTSRMARRNVPITLPTITLQTLKGKSDDEAWCNS